MTRPTEPPAAGLGVRVDRPGQGRRLLPRRDLPNGPKALWTSHVRRSPPRRFDDTSRDRAPPNQRYAPRPRSPDNDSDSLSLAPSSDGSDDEYGPSTGLARRKHQSENEVASAAALAAAQAAWAALSDSEDEEVREDTAPTRAVEASPTAVARFNARDRTVSPAPAVQIRARARTMSPPRYADTRRRGSSPRGRTPCSLCTTLRRCARSRCTPRRGTGSFRKTGRRLRCQRPWCPCTAGTPWSLPARGRSSWCRRRRTRARTKRCTART